MAEKLHPLFIRTQNAVKACDEFSRNHGGLCNNALHEELSKAHAAWSKAGKPVNR